MGKSFKGFLVTFTKEVGKEEIEDYKMILRYLINVHTVTAYEKGAEDYMSEELGYFKCHDDIRDMIMKKIKIGEK